MSAGAASRKMRPDSRISPLPARSMRATTTSVAIASARSNPVARMMMAAMAVAAKAYRSVSTCATAPSMLRLRRALAPFALASSQLAARLTQTPANATPSIRAPATGWGAISLRIAS